VRPRRPGDATPQRQVRATDATATRHPRANEAPGTRRNRDLPNGAVEWFKEPDKAKQAKSYFASEGSI